MAGSWTTLPVKDAAGATKTMRVWDESGTGAGPFSFGQMLADGLGGALDILNDIVLAAGTHVIGKTGIDQTTPGTTNKVYLTNFNKGDYETVAASQTDQAMGATGATGDFLSHVLIIPATTSPGAVSIKDGAGSSITIFTGGPSSVSNLVPFSVAVGAKSTSGAWKITTGANVSAMGVGDFT